MISPFMKKYINNDLSNANKILVRVLSYMNP